MKRVLLPCVLLAVAAAATIWLRPVTTPAPSLASDPANSDSDPRCDCGAELSHSHTSAKPADLSASAANTTKSGADWAAELRAQLVRVESPADLHSTLVELVGRDGRRAMEAALAVARNPLERHDLAAMTAEIWGAIDATAAWHWSQRESASLDQPDRDPVYAAALNGIASMQPELVASLIERMLADNDALPDSWSPTELTQAAVVALMKSGQYTTVGSTLTRWHAELAPQQLNDTIFATLAAAWSDHAPVEAATWLLALPESGRRGQGLEALASNWAEAAPAAALDWAVSLPEQPGRDAILAAAFSQWVDQDPMAAAQWLGKHEAEPAADRMVHTLLNSSTLASKHPHEAARWAGLIDNPELRIDVLKNALHHWAQRDAPGALAFVQNNRQLSATQLSELVAIVRESPPATRD